MWPSGHRSPRVIDEALTPAESIVSRGMAFLGNGAGLVKSFGALPHVLLLSMPVRKGFHQGVTRAYPPFV